MPLGIGKTGSRPTPSEQPHHRLIGIVFREVRVALSDHVRRCTRNQRQLDGAHAASEHLRHPGVPEQVGMDAASEPRPGSRVPHPLERCRGKLPQHALFGPVSGRRSSALNLVTEIPPASTVVRRLPFSRTWLERGTRGPRK